MLILGARPEPGMNCLRCDKLVAESEWDRNNGTCDECPELEGKGENPFDRRSQIAARSMPTDESPDGDAAMA